MPLPNTNRRAPRVLNCISTLSTVQEEQYLDFRQVDRTLEALTLIEDDDHRRRQFKAFIKDSVAIEGRASLASWTSHASPFVQFANARLAAIGQQVQTAEWNTYVTSGFQELPTQQPPQQWACVDMLVQLGSLVRQAEAAQFQTKNKKLKSPVSSCKRNCTFCTRKKGIKGLQDKEVLLP